MARKDLEQRLMRRLVDGVAAWATYYQAGHPVAHYNEHMFYDPILDIALGRGWRARKQESISGSTGGNQKSIDFVIFRSPTLNSNRSPLAFIEVKYFRGKKPGQDITNLRKDIDKLSSLTASNLACTQLISGCSAPAKFLFIVGRGKEFDNTISYNFQKNTDVAQMFQDAVSKKLPTVYKSSITSHLKKAEQWNAIAIGSPRWPK